MCVWGETSERVADEWNDNNNTNTNKDNRTKVCVLHIRNQKGGGRTQLNLQDVQTFSFPPSHTE